jgi:hypothetical protein
MRIFAVRLQCCDDAAVPCRAVPCNAVPCRAYRRSRERALLAGLTTALARGAAGLLCRWKRLAVCSVSACTQ